MRTKDLASDRFSQISPTVLFRLNYLYNDGARICLMSEHAPAFFTLQMSAAKLNTPQIVMDGAAIYDANENVYLQAETIAPEDSARLKERLEKLGLSCFIYTIHNNKTCIFHQGEITEPEKVVYEQMKSSPYRSYLEGEIYEPQEIVYFKILAEEGRMGEIEYSLRNVLPRGRLRGVRRAQSGAPGIVGLYIYAHTATMEQAEKRLMEMLHAEEPELEPVQILTNAEYRSERDAVHLLHQVEKYYEPTCFSRN